jgi:hypothetical protein
MQSQKGLCWQTCGSVTRGHYATQIADMRRTCTHVGKAFEKGVSRSNAESTTARRTTIAPRSGVYRLYKAVTTHAWTPEHQ